MAEPIAWMGDLVVKMPGRIGRPLSFGKVARPNAGVNQPAGGLLDGCIVRNRNFDT